MEAVDQYIARTDEEMKRMYGTYLCPNCKAIHDYDGRCRICGFQLINVNDVDIEDDEIEEPTLRLKASRGNFNKLKLEEN